MLGAWDRWYVGAERDVPRSYGDDATYKIGAYWLAGCATVADWGCGLGGLRAHLPPSVRYVGVDGSNTPHADVIADLAAYRVPSDGVFLRHVLEHNHCWRLILANAVAAARQRLVVILFTPLADETHVIAVNDDLGVPDISFALDDLGGVLVGCRIVDARTLSTDTQYGVETVLLIEKGE